MSKSWTDTRRSLIGSFSYKVTSELDLNGRVQRVAQRHLSTTAYHDTYAGKLPLRCSVIDSPTKSGATDHSS